MSDTSIQVTTLNGKPLDAIPKNAPFRVEVRLPRPKSGKPPDTIKVKFKSKAGTETLTLAWTKNHRGPLVYRSNRIKMESGAEGGASVTLGPFEFGTGGMDGLETENGEQVTVSYDGGSTSITVYDSWHELTIAELRKLFDMAEAYWKKIKDKLTGVDDADAKKLVKLADIKLGIIKRGRAYLDNEKLWPRERTAIASLYLGWLRGAGLGYDPRDETDTVAGTKRNARQRSMEVIWREVQNIALGLYALVTNATSTAQIFTLFTGKTIFGKKATFSEKVAAAIDLATGAAMEVAGMKANLDRMPRRRDDDVGGVKFAKPKQGADPEAVDAGELVLPLDFGVHRVGTRHARRVADKHNVVFVVRPANLDSLPWQARGYPRKPMAIKDKTINRLDVHLGARKEDVGLVGHFKPKKPTRAAGMDDATWTAVQKRYKDRMAAWDDNHPKLVKLEKEGQVELKDGLIIDRGLCGNTGKPITGDYDLFGVHNRRTGRLLDGDEVEQLILPDLRGGGFDAKHGAHLNWRPQDSVGQGIFRGIVGRHTSTNKRREALLVVGGRSDGPAFTTFYDLDFKMPFRTWELGGSRVQFRPSFGRMRFTELMQGDRALRAKTKRTESKDSEEDTGLEDWLKEFAGATPWITDSILEENGDESEADEADAPTIKTSGSSVVDESDPNVIFSDAWFKAQEGKPDPWAHIYEDDRGGEDDEAEDELEPADTSKQPFGGLEFDASKLPSWVPWLLGGAGVACLMSAACFLLFGSAWFFGRDLIEGFPLSAAETEAPLVTSTPLPTPTPTHSPTPDLRDQVRELGPYEVTGGQAIEMGMPGSELLLLAGFFTEDDPADWIYSVPGVAPGSPSGLTDIVHFMAGSVELVDGAEGPLYNDSLFPCGASGERTVVCTTEMDPLPMPPGEMLMAVMVLDEPLPTPVTESDPAAPGPPGSGGKEHIYALVLETDQDASNNFIASSQFAWDYYQNTDTWYELVGNPASGSWQLYVTDRAGVPASSSARVVIEQNVITFFVGAEELGDLSLASYRMSAFQHDGSYSVASASGDVTGSDPTEATRPIIDTGLSFSGPPG